MESEKTLDIRKSLEIENIRKEVNVALTFWNDILRDESVEEDLAVLSAEAVNEIIQDAMIRFFEVDEQFGIDFINHMMRSLEGIEKKQMGSNVQRKTK